MNKNYNYHFKTDKLWKYRQKIEKESKELIEILIKNHSPIQLGEDVETISFGEETEMMRVTAVELMAVSNLGFPGDKLSFYYEGIPLGKNGKPMKNRKPKCLGAFIKNGQWYYCPSYYRVKIIPAKMHQTNEY